MDPTGFLSVENSLDPMMLEDIKSFNWSSNTDTYTFLTKNIQKTMFIEACAGSQEVSLGSFWGLLDMGSL